MSFPKMTEPVNNISQLDTRPNAVNGLTADQLKAEFDKGPQAIKKFLNEVLIPALDGAVTLEALGAVPNTRTVARKALSADILLDESDIDYDGTIDGTRVQGDLGDAIDTIGQKLGNAVPNTRTVNGKTLAQDIRLGASDIDYSGKIGEYEASNVGGAIEALVTTIDGYPSNGNPLDMTDDYTASGAASVEQWATMAKVADGVASTTEYRIAQGRYRVTKNADVYDVTVMDASGRTERIVLISSVNSDPYWYFDVYSVTAPGSKVTSLLYLSTEEDLLQMNGLDVKLPSYNNATDSADNGKLLMLKNNSWGVYPAWVAMSGIIDATEDYESSGATSVEQWATMAKVVDGVASTTEYRIAPGRYRIVDDGDDPYDVTVINSSDPTRRYVQIITVSDDGVWTFNVYWTLEPSDALIHIVRFAPDEAMLEFGNGKNMLLPNYSNVSSGGIPGNFLRLVKIGNAVIPRWGYCDATNFLYQCSSHIVFPNTISDALDELFKYGIVDATENFKNSGAGNVAAWAGMEDARDATRYRVPSGTYRVRDSDSDGNYVEHIVTIVDTTYELDNGQVLRYRMVEDKFCGNEPCIIVDCYQFGAPGEQNQSLRYYGDDEEFIVNGVNKHWLPEVTAADNGKFLQVVNGNWEAAKPPTYDGGVS